MVPGEELPRGLGQFVDQRTDAVIFGQVLALGEHT
jgi:hypothetical protein